MTVYTDADSCPRKTRDVIIRAARRTGVRAVFSANRPIPGIPDEPNFFMEVCPAGPNKADDFIVDNAVPGDLVITRDVPLAERLVKRHITVLDDRGRLFTTENIRYYLSMRNVTIFLAKNNAGGLRHANYGSKEKKSFAAAFDRELCRLLMAKYRENEAGISGGTAAF
ncbi:MAG: DUF188 domain-containing protein [Spirochaetaceae bacterium]|jgi:uncharacterized protein YaiI (UPF0178 family)|nr:DUF188 domain-containing protein [Spirochaetaceae bacterium]